MRRNNSPFLAIIFLVLLAGCGTGPGSPIPRSPIPVTSSASAIPATESATPGQACIASTARREEALVTGVTDGDSIVVDVGGVPFRVRYIGIDAPEMAGEELGEESRTANRTLVGGKSIVMIRDLSEADRYGRLLRYVFADGVFVNRELVRLGLARAGYYPPDISCMKELRAAQDEAREARLGIWGLLGSPTYATRVGEGCAGGCLTPPAGCRIKGNISLDRKKIYHVPGGKYYEQTVIEPEKGERWFCSEEEAIAAGWRKSKV